MTAPNPAEQLVGAVLNGRFRLVRLLGEGGMGAVYEADSTRGEGKRAVKLLHQEFVKEEQILQRFFAEAQASQGLRHPNVAQVFESQTAEDGTPYLVMELLQGSPLAAYMESSGAIPPAHAVPIIYGVLQALSLAHARGIVHRDLKPDNLFMTRDQMGNSVVKVLDFGIAKVMDAAGGMGQKTRTGVLLGTPGYMSPEQIKNSKGVDARSDLWSLGIIFYEMLTNRQPFPADNEFARLTAVLTEEIVPIERVAPHLAHWAPFFQRALAKDLNQRYASAEEMARGLMQIANGGAQPQQQPQHAPPTQQPQRTEAFHMPPSMQQQPRSMPTPQSGPYPPQSGMQQVQVRPQQPQQPQQHQPQQQPSVPPPSPYAGPHGGSTQPSAQPFQAGVPTHMSVQRPPGSPAPTSQHPPSVQVVSAPPTSSGAPYWVVAVVGLLCLGLGFVIGFVAH
jgi:serine/threonine-protein kinase